MSRNRGFTLLELLVAIALLALLTAALYGTYFSLMSGRDRADAVAEASRELRTTVDTLRREIAAACYKSPADPAKPRYFFVVEDRDFFGKPASTLTMTTFAPPASGAFPSSDQMAVAYRPVAKDKVMALTRQAKVLDFDVKQPLVYPQMEELESFLVECYDGSKWVRSWDARLNNGLPKQVRVTVTVREGDKSMAFVALATPRVTN
ncbi:MAG TPA: type II secretion system protein GspJ [Geobacteraceae bacterium]